MDRLATQPQELRVELPEFRDAFRLLKQGVHTRIPLAIALEMTLTGDNLDAARADELGLVNQVVAPNAVATAFVDERTPAWRGR